MNKNWENVRNEIEKKASDNLLISDMGHYFKYAICSDIKHLEFTLSRYKFASKLVRFCNKIDVLECGCSEALGGLMFLQNTDLNSYTGIDFDRASIEWNKENLINDKFHFIEDDFLACSEIEGKRYDVILSLDVIEHVEKRKENAYCKVFQEHLKKDGSVILGTPSVRMDPYTSVGSKLGHINLFDQERLYHLMKKYFSNVYIFNMNDEVVNMGFDAMACYMFALCSGPLSLEHI